MPAFQALLIFPWITLPGLVNDFGSFVHWTISLNAERNLGIASPTEIWRQRKGLPFSGSYQLCLQKFSLVTRTYMFTNKFECRRSLNSWFSERFKLLTEKGVARNSNPQTWLRLRRLLIPVTELFLWNRRSTQAPSASRCFLFNSSRATSKRPPTGKRYWLTSGPSFGFYRLFANSWYWLNESIRPFLGITSHFQLHLFGFLPSYSDTGILSSSTHFTFKVSRFEKI